MRIVNHRYDSPLFFFSSHDVDATKAGIGHASGYIVNSSYYDRLINLYELAMVGLEKTKMHWVYANDVIWKSLQKKDKWYCIKNRVGVQRAGFSDNRNSFQEQNNW